MAEVWVCCEDMGGTEEEEVDEWLGTVETMVREVNVCWEELLSILLGLG